MIVAEPAIWGGVIVAAGQGQRFGRGDKLMTSLNGRPVICWSIGALAAAERFRELVIVTSADNCEDIREASRQHFPALTIQTCLGGPTRSASVRAGLEVLSDAITHVAIHDGARPLVSAALVGRVVEAAERHGAAVACIAPTSSIGVRSWGREFLAGTLDRSRLVEMQTPQAARREDFLEALARWPDETDESSALFKAGCEVFCVPGERSNIKITEAEDLAIAGALAACLDGSGTCA